MVRHAAGAVAECDNWSVIDTTLHALDSGSVQGENVYCAVDSIHFTDYI